LPPFWGEEVKSFRQWTLRRPRPRE